MTQPSAKSAYLILSRGQWDEDKSPEEIQQTIEAFYAWHEKLVSEGRAKAGSRLQQATALVSKHGVTDGPFAETKEVIGGYWFFYADSFEEAVALAAQNPCLACGLSYEVRPLEPEKCSAYEQTNETPASRRASR